MKMWETYQQTPRSNPNDDLLRRIINLEVSLKNLKQTIINICTEVENLKKTKPNLGMSSKSLEDTLSALDRRIKALEVQPKHERSPFDIQILT